MNEYKELVITVRRKKIVATEYASREELRAAKRAEKNRVLNLKDRIAFAKVKHKAEWLVTSRRMAVTAAYIPPPLPMVVRSSKSPLISKKPIDKDKESFITCIPV